MALVNPVATMIIFDARAVPPATAGGKVKVPIDFLVDSHTLSYEDDKGSRKYELDFHAAAYAPDGKVISHADVGTKAGVKAENVAALEQGGFPVSHGSRVAAWPIYFAPRRPRHAHWIHRHRRSSSHDWKVDRCSGSTA